jgi:hypothetical protein
LLDETVATDPDLRNIPDDKKNEYEYENKNDNDKESDNDLECCCIESSSYLFSAVVAHSTNDLLRLGPDFITYHLFTMLNDHDVMNCMRTSKQMLKYLQYYRVKKEVSLRYLPCVFTIGHIRPVPVLQKIFIHLDYELYSYDLNKINDRENR